MIGKLLDVDNMLERTSSPNMAIVFLNVFMTRMADFLGGLVDSKEVAEHTLAWRDDFASSMVSHKDRRVNVIEQMMKKAPELVQVTPGQQSPPQAKTGRFFNRAKEEYE